MNNKLTSVSTITHTMHHSNHHQATSKTKGAKLKH